MKRALVVAVCVAAIGSRLAGAQAADDRAALRDALQHYNALVQRMEHDSIAALYTADGFLEAPGRAPLVGPAAIRQYLHSLSDFKVISQRMTSDSIRIRGDTAQQTGRWWQRVRVPKGDTVSVGGTFSAEWRRQRGAWHLRQMNALPTRVLPDSTS